MIEPSKRYRATFHGGARAASSIRTVVIHSTEGATAEGAAAWFASGRAGGSAHVVVDDEHAFRCLEDAEIAYGAHPFNGSGLHLEVAGFAAWNREQWEAHEGRLDAAAEVIAGWCARYAIPLLLVDWEGDSRAGITTHAEIVQRTGVGNHTDPGVGFPLDCVLAKIAACLEPTSTTE